MRTRVGLIGCGDVSKFYLDNCVRARSLEVVGCADIVPERAQVRAAQYGIPARTTKDLLSDPSITLLINLTHPRSHMPLNLAALAAGKSVYSEKPLGILRSDGQRLLGMTNERVRIGCAPDTFLGDGLQTCRKLIDKGTIGSPVAATAFMAVEGPERWHPDPAFLYELGAGPLMDMGPYYLTALIVLLGPIRSVTAMAKAAFLARTINSGPRRGEKFDVEVPTHVSATLEMASGVIVTFITSFDTRAHGLPQIEIYGTEATLSVPDPDTFGGPVLVRQSHDSTWEEVQLTYPYNRNLRGLGVVDMVYGLQSGYSHRASGELAFHVLDAMEAILESVRDERHVHLSSSCARPDPLPAAFAHNAFELACTDVIADCRGD